MKYFLLFIFFWSYLLLSCDPGSTRSRSIPLKNLELEKTSKVDTTQSKFLKK